MSPRLIALAVAALCALGARASIDTAPDPLASAGGLARGWGDSYSWTPYADAFAAAQAQDKPILLVIWKTWCGACKALRPAFAASAAIAAESDGFVMVNVVDDEEPQEERFKPDGGYIPRILFLDGRSGAVMTDVVNAGGNDKYKYYYSDPGGIALSMQKVKARAAAAKGDAADAAGDL